MIKKWTTAIFFFLTMAFLLPAYGNSQEMTRKDIIRELKVMKERISRLETELVKRDKAIQEFETKSVKQQRKEEPSDRDTVKWTDRIMLSGAVEVESAIEHHDIKDPTNNFQPGSTQTDDIVLATVELGIDVDFNKYTKGQVLFLYEEDDTDPVTIDQATFILGGIEETYGCYIKGGKYYPHFGELNSYFVSSPLTLEVFEINESAIEAGYDGIWFSTVAGVFHGNIEKQLNTDTQINGFFADANVHNPPETLGGISLLAGASYLSNIADSDTLQDEVQDINGDGNTNDLSDYVAGFAAYLFAEYKRFSFGAEYIMALDDFRAGEMGYAIDKNGSAQKTRPSAWNVEFAFKPIEDVQLAAKYEGTEEMFGLFPEHQYGGVVSWELIKNTTLSAEYLHCEYDENNRNADGQVEDKRDIFTVQLAVEF